MGQFSYRHILCCLAVVSAIFLLPVLSGCGLISDSDQPDCPSAVSDDITVSFRIVAGNPASTRAEEEYGSFDESYIDLNNLKVLIFDEEQTLYQVLYDNGTPAEGTSLTSVGLGMYVLKTKLDPERYSMASKFFIVVMANWQSSDDARLVADWGGIKLDESEISRLKIEDLKGMTFTLNPNVAYGSPQPESWMPGEGTGWIPMFGSRYTSLDGYDATKYNSGSPMPLPDVQLVRGMSKIEIENKDLGDHSPVIEKITLVLRNQRGRLMQDHDFRRPTGNVTSPTVSPFDPSITDVELPFHQDGNKYSVFLPEMVYANADARRMICVHLSMNGEKHQKWIYLAPYGSDGNPILNGAFDSDWDSLKRNYIYRYVINSLAFELLIDVEPWIFGGKVHIDLEG